ncbi:hypothetical protein NEOLEDRAFT_728372 [Neolentinus lepideus HHB14362 ss-1]|uniref:C2H2-type domain-containing protein n=1 Tax=Neolentinus lepideus HHB14362 ss-1 TaxID=1314782 RepID=A0A165Q0Q0_9AGAM|nr:hypothetical protein NEOLEDRAFT_728372 [Neolentinus lepideus HHB14362 ss-1]
MPVTIPLSDLCQSHLAIALDNTSPDGLLLRSMTPVPGVSGFSANRGSLDGVYISFSLAQGDHGLYIYVYPSTSPESTGSRRTGISAPTYHVNTSAAYDQNSYPSSSQNGSTVFDTSTGSFDYALAESIQQAFAPANNFPLTMDEPCMMPTLTTGPSSEMSSSITGNEIEYSSVSLEKLLSPSLLSDSHPAHHNNYCAQSGPANILSTMDAIAQWQNVSSSKRSSPVSSTAVSSSSSSPALSSASANVTLLSDELIQFDSTNYYECSSPDSSLGSGATLSSPPSPTLSVPHATFSSFPSSGTKSGMHTSKTMPRQARRRRFPCLHSSCTRLFTSEYTRRVHMATHTIQPRKALPCTMREQTGCMEMFSRAHDRLRHEVAMHGKECEWVCNVCGRFFSTARMLEIHKCPGTISGWIKARCPRILGDISA